REHGQDRRYGGGRRLSMLRRCRGRDDRLALTLINEMENAVINLNTLNTMVEAFNDHPHDTLTRCQHHVYWVGRWWCDKPFLRWFTQFGMVRLDFIE
ncbi:unnamed protein product, partial [Laminaria digitata]